MKQKDIKALVESWCTTGVITNEQQAYMLRSIDDYSSEASSGRLITSILYIGAVALSLGFLLVIASNWEYFGTTFKMILAMLLPVVPLTFAYWRQEINGRTSMLTQAANVCGVALIGGSLALVDQVYHLPPDMQRLVWLWALLSAPFVFVFRSAANVCLTVLLLGVAVLYSLFTYLDAVSIDEQTGIILVTAVTLLYAACMYALGGVIRTSAVWDMSGRFLRLGGAGIALTVFFVTTFEFYARAIMGYSYDESALPLSLVFNFIFVCFLVYALLRAIRYEEYQFAFSIVRLFGVYLLVKYVTLFYGMLDTGLFFIGGGILFIAGALLLEKKKKYLISYMQGSRSFNS